ncbi:KxYKxGKxW signal peptide domain-containing protein [Lentilactobacillus sp. Marseille-Q4993]|uniref:KxYKxGKxW signal peptide domain-containing protein n=1 Tax=Lentilactobacillus sp. Marseille-Q4993 TaxID=3039492 RepID=UPI0024BC5D40|nr:KxYKxGKxW signal peptide domain-containing protein [Lentilactobacillus sp. Marseille-Q4993]
MDRFEEKVPTHYRMYKKGKMWLFSCAFVLTLGAAGSATATADTTNTKTDNQPATYTIAQPNESSDSSDSNEASLDVVDPDQTQSQTQETTQSDSSVTSTTDTESTEAQPAQTVTNNQNEANVHTESSQAEATASTDNNVQATQPASQAPVQAEQATRTVAPKVTKSTPKSIKAVKSTKGAKSTKVTTKRVAKHAVKRAAVKKASVRVLKHTNKLFKDTRNLINKKYIKYYEIHDKDSNQFGRVLVNLKGSWYEVDTSNPDQPASLITDNNDLNEIKTAYDQGKVDYYAMPTNLLNEYLGTTLNKDGLYKPINGTLYKGYEIVTTNSDLSAIRDQYKISDEVLKDMGVYNASLTYHGLENLVLPVVGKTQYTATKVNGDSQKRTILIKNENDKKGVVYVQDKNGNFVTDKSIQKEYDSGAKMF